MVPAPASQRSIGEACGGGVDVIVGFGVVVGVGNGESTGVGVGVGVTVGDGCGVGFKVGRFTPVPEQVQGAEFVLTVI